MSGCEWRLHSHEEEEVGAPHGAAAPPPIYRGVGAPSPHTLEHTLAPLSLLPLLHLSAIRLAKPWLIMFSTTPHRRAVDFFGGSSTSAAPLDRGNGGRHQAVHVTEYGGAARCSVHLHDLEIGK